jgi:hypothetical protein
MLQTILAISGKPGLYKLISRGKMNLIVESIDAAKKRMPAFATDRVTSLADIAMFTDADDIPLKDVLTSLKNKENGQICSIDPKKSTSNDLRQFFSEILPNYDHDRVHDSDIKKLISWYNILIQNGISDFEEDMKPTEGDNLDNRK